MTTKRVKMFSDEHKINVVLDIAMCGDTEHGVRILTEYEKLVRQDERRKAMKSK